MILESESKMSSTLPVIKPIGSKDHDIVSWAKDNWKIIVAATAIGVVGLFATKTFIGKNKKSSSDSKSKTTKKSSVKTDANSTEKKSDASSELKKAHAALLEKDPSILSDEERSKYALQVKEIGNKFYKERDFENALVYYSKAIDFKKDCVFYANRAACYVSLGQNEKVFDECTKALELDPTYTKAITRRALAYESIGQYEKALIDYSSAATLQLYRQESTVTSCERALKLLTQEKVKELSKDRKFRLPSKSFISAYMESFCETSRGINKILSMGTEKEGDVLLQSAFTAIQKKEWEEAYKCVKNAKESGKFSKEWEDLSYNLSATFDFIVGDNENAMININKALEIAPERISSIIKRAAIHMERGEFQEAVGGYESAVKIGTTDSDAHYHYAQFLILQEKVEYAIAEYKKAIELDDSFLFAHIQLGVSHYKNRDVASSMQVFERAIRKFKDNSVIYNYFGELCLDLQNFDKALENIEKSIELDPSSPLPYINKAMLYLQWKNDVETAKDLCKKAIEVDPLSDVAWTQLGQLETHSLDFEKAIDCYKHSLELVRSDVDLTNIITILELAKAQSHVHKTYPDAIKKIQNIVSSGQQ